VNSLEIIRPELLTALVSAVAVWLATGIAYLWQRRTSEERKFRSMQVVEATLEKATRENRRIQARIGRRLTGDSAEALVVGGGELAQSISETLNRFEYLAVGVNARVFDLGVVDRLAGEILLSVWLYYRPLIQAQRSLARNPDVYHEFEMLVHRIQATGRPSPAEGQAFRDRWPEASSPASPLGTRL